MHNTNPLYQRAQRALFAGESASLTAPAAQLAHAQRLVLEAHRLARRSDAIQNSPCPPAMLRLVSLLEQLIGDIEQTNDRSAQ